MRSMFGPWLSPLCASESDPDSGYPEVEAGEDYRRFVTAKSRSPVAGWGDDEEEDIEDGRVSQVQAEAEEAEEAGEEMLEETGGSEGYYGEEDHEDSYVVPVEEEPTEEYHEEGAGVSAAGD
eukprot:GHVT01100586.1.p1 GENE.GHVT01100586.1~~GHVT01100586.1.p1  ORF type:complete len:122 (-),score=34.88 GHVT01100586.1:890-1255(-)